MRDQKFSIEVGVALLLDELAQELEDRGWREAAQFTRDVGVHAFITSPEYSGAKNDQRD
jgi:hypothetical protein